VASSGLDDELIVIVFDREGDCNHKVNNMKVHTKEKPGEIRRHDYLTTYRTLEYMILCAYYDMMV